MSGMGHYTLGECWRGRAVGVVGGSPRASMDSAPPSPLEGRTLLIAFRSCLEPDSCRTTHFSLTFRPDVTVRANVTCCHEDGCNTGVVKCEYGGQPCRWNPGIRAPILSSRSPHLVSGIPAPHPALTTPLLTPLPFQSGGRTQVSGLLIPLAPVLQPPLPS